MIAEAIAQLQEYAAPVIEAPVLCSRCKEELIPAMPEEERDAEIEALQGETIFYLFDERVCETCFEGDRFEAAYRKADLD